MGKLFLKLLPFLAAASLVLTGCAQQTGQTGSPPDPSMTAKAEKPSGPVYKGRVVGKSNKAKTISLEVGKGAKAQTIMMRFDDQTKGIEYATKGHAIIVSYVTEGKDVYAKSIKPKLAKLPKGTSLIQTDELFALINKGEEFELIDSRPAARYGQAHLPGAISIPVCEMQELIGLLPKDKNRPLVFYCGGPT